LKTPENCPNCGADLSPNAKACPECGSDEKTGWSEDAYVSRLDLPDEKFEYATFVENEFGKKKIVPGGMNWLWWSIAIIVIAVFVLLGLR